MPPSSTCRGPILDKVWEAVGKLAATMHVDRITAVADAIQRVKTVDEFHRVRAAFGPNVDQGHVERLREAWTTASEVQPAEISAAFRGAAQVTALSEGRESIELVWTGPNTGLIPTRRTEQVLLEVINSARAELFLVTFVFYRVPSIVKALNIAAQRGVKINVLLDVLVKQGGAIGGTTRALAGAVPKAAIYVWDLASEKTVGSASSASVHAKCVVADRKLAFISSANLTSAALERNMELGLLVRGGTVPARLYSHLEALVTTETISRWTL